MNTPTVKSIKQNCLNCNSNQNGVCVKGIIGKALTLNDRCSCPRWTARDEDLEALRRDEAAEEHRQDRISEAKYNAERNKYAKEEGGEYDRK